MKNISILLVLLSLISLASCQFTEEITIDENGSGKYKLNIDMSMMMDAMKGMENNDSIKKEPEKIDSTFYMKEIIEQHKDSIANLTDAEKESLKAIENLQMRIQMDEEKNTMLMDFMLDFKDLSELDEIKEKVKKAQQLQDKKGQKEENVENHEVKYSYVNDVFKRSVTMKKLTDKEKASYEKTMGQAEMFLSGSMYKIIYHFPKKIKAVSFPDVKYSDDHKTMTIAVAMDSILTNPKILDFEVKF